MNGVRTIILRFLEKLEKALRADKIENLKRSGLLEIGAYTYGVHNLQIDVYKGSEIKVKIGKYCSLAPNINIITGGVHPVDRISTYPFRIQWKLPERYTDGMPYSKGDIVIGNDVWIGTGVTILSGVEVGHGAVLAAGAVISKNVPPYAVVAGNPAKVLRYRFEEEVIKEIIALKWWDWEKSKIIAHINDFQSTNIFNIKK